MSECDVLIVGCGLSGLLVANELKTKMPHLNITILEKNTPNHIQHPFDGRFFIVSKATVEYLQKKLGLQIQPEVFIERWHFGEDLWHSLDFNEPREHISYTLLKETLKKSVLDMGVSIEYEQKVIEVKFNYKRSHTIITHDEKFDCKWVVDASGQEGLFRNGLNLKLSFELALHELQACCKQLNPHPFYYIKYPGAIGCAFLENENTHLQLITTSKFINSIPSALYNVKIRPCRFYNVFQQISMYRWALVGRAAFNNWPEYYIEKICQNVSNLCRLIEKDLKGESILGDIQGFDQINKKYSSFYEASFNFKYFDQSYPPNIEALLLFITRGFYIEFGKEKAHLLYNFPKQIIEHHNNLEIIFIELEKTISQFFDTIYEHGHTFNQSKDQQFHIKLDALLNLLDRESSQKFTNFFEYLYKLLNFERQLYKELGFHLQKHYPYVAKTYWPTKISTDHTSFILKEFNII